jgi:hypothetical protein
MGLDQYAGLRNEDGTVKEEFYWRKHARLQQLWLVNSKSKIKKQNIILLMICNILDLMVAKVV